MRVFIGGFIAAADDMRSLLVCYERAVKLPSYSVSTQAGITGSKDLPGLVYNEARLIEIGFISRLPSGHRTSIVVKEAPTTRSR